MRFEVTSDMQKRIYVYAITILIAIILGSILLYFNEFKAMLENVISVVSPFLFGTAIAFILHQPVIWFEKKVLSKYKWKQEKKRLLSTAVIFVLFLCIVCLFFILVIPNLIHSVQTFIVNINTYSSNYYELARDIIDALNLTVQDVESLVEQYDLFGFLTQRVADTIPQLAILSWVAIQGLIKIILTLVSAFYILLDTEKLVLGIKKINYALFSKTRADYLRLWANDAIDVFQKFIVGSLIDSSIIGFICYIGCILLNIPYAVMVAVIVGITNVIPVFGPFLGAIPCIVILLMIQPIYALIFAIFILVLQQIDGNVVKPIVLGDQLGISGFWILFSVTIGGGLFGILGMFLGVPIFALIYAAIRDYSQIKLEQKNVVFQEAIEK